MWTRGEIPMEKREKNWSLEKVMGNGTENKDENKHR